MKQLMGHFRFSGILAVVCFALAYAYAGLNGLFAAAVLAVLEVSFSFDNAVVNAGILQHWNHYWRTIFLTLGMAVAVLDACCSHWLLYHKLLICLFASAWNLALNDPKAYSAALISHHAEVLAYGGSFLFWCSLISCSTLKRPSLAFMVGRKDGISWSY